MIARVRGAVMALVLAALVGACAPRLAPMGPVAGEPYLRADAMVTADRAILPLRVWLPDGEVQAVVVGLHGFNDYSNAFAMPAKSWVRYGIATYAYDQRGFGEAPDRGMWPGTETLVEDLATAVRLVKARHPGKPVFVVGESMGGAVILAAAARGQLDGVEGAVLTAPAVRGRETINVFGRVGLWLMAHTVPWLAGRPPPNLGFHPSDNIEMLRALARDPLVIKETRIDAFYGLIDLMDDALAAAPSFDVGALILIGQRDDLIPPEHIEIMLDRLPPAAPSDRRVAIYPNGYHMLLRDLQAPVVHRDVAHWMLTRRTNPMAALPSGADGLGRAGIAAARKAPAAVAIE